MQPPLKHQRTINGGAIVFFVLWCIGQIARDQTWVTGLCFYIPSLFVGVLFAFLTFVRWRQKSRIGWIFLAIAGLAGFCVCFVDNSIFGGLWVESQTPTSTHTLVHWNVFDGQFYWQSGHNRLVAMAPEIIVLSEPPSPERVRALSEALGAEYDYQRFGSMAAIARGELAPNNTLADEENYEVNQFYWTFGGKTYQIFGVDCSSDIFHHRHPTLGKVNSLIAEHQPDFIVGDFNAPRRSLALQQLPTGYVHAYESVGTGLSYTWPWPVPMYSLDQCIVRQPIRIDSYELISGASDHRLQFLRFGQ